MKDLHPKIQELKDRTAGQFLTCRYADSGFQIRAVPDTERRYKDDPRVIEGYLAVWGVKDTYGTVAVKGCFAKSLQERGPKSKAKDKIIHLFMHGMLEPVGSYLELEEDDYGLRFACRVDDVEGTPERVLIQTKSGTINQYSYGFEYVWDKMEYDEEKDAILMYECNLYEGSSVTIRASNKETFTIRSKEDLQGVLQALNLEAEETISNLPLKYRTELKQLVTRYNTLVETKPEQKPPLDLSYKPGDVATELLGYKVELNKF